MTDAAPEVSEATKPSRLTMCVKVRISKPLDGDWERHGARLRALSWVAHRVLNGTISRLELAAEHPELAPEEWKSKSRPGAAKNKGGKAYEYPMAKIALEKANAFRKEPVEGVPSAIQLGWARLASQRFKNDRKDVLKGAKSISSFRSPAPVAFSGAAEVAHDGTGYVLSVPLYQGGQTGTVRFALAPDGPNAHAHFRKMVSPDAKVGDLKIVWNKGKRNVLPHWLAIVAYSISEPAKPVGRAGEIVVHRGIRNFLTAAWIPGQGRGEVRTLAEGDGIRRTKDKFSARRRSLGRHRKDLAPGAKGHGSRRRLEHASKVDDAEARWVRSMCQESAAKVVAFAARHGAARVLIEDYSKPYGDDDDRQSGALVRKWPWAQLGDAISWACRRAGLEVGTYVGAFASSTCPSCGHVEAANADRRSFRFVCLKCDFRHHIDAVACMNGHPNRAVMAKAASAALKEASHGH